MVTILETEEPLAITMKCKRTLYELKTHSSINLKENEALFIDVIRVNQEKDGVSSSNAKDNREFCERVCRIDFQNQGELCVFDYIYEDIPYEMRVFVMSGSNIECENQKLTITNHRIVPLKCTRTDVNNPDDEKQVLKEASKQEKKAPKSDTVINYIQPSIIKLEKEEKDS